MSGDAIPESWRPALESALASPEARRFGGWLRAEEDAGKTIYPPRGSRLRAFELTSLDAVKAVILGQDPYHGPGQAMGLAFSVPAGVRIPPSLRNIYKELESDLGLPPPRHGDLRHWAEQGVLLLNASLTVEAGSAGSHAGKGWEAVTDAAIAAVAARSQPTVFILWGSHAQAKAARIPSPLSAHRGFFREQAFQPDQRLPFVARARGDRLVAVAGRLNGPFGGRHHRVIRARSRKRG
jgi:uracil-DNA glycosylase